MQIKVTKNTYVYRQFFKDRFKTLINLDFFLVKIMNTKNTYVYSLFCARSANFFILPWPQKFSKAIPPPPTLYQIWHLDIQKSWKKLTFGDIFLKFF